MGDLQLCDGQPNGVVSEDRLFQSNPDPLSIGENSWVLAEKATQEVVCCTQPTWSSQQKRKDVIEYIQSLIRCSLGLEVFTYGSVPLKTYLPDGDIDLTALGSANGDDVLARDVLAVLQAEEHNENAEYEVKDTQFIDAEVKLVKCLVQNIVIDISFNQLGGLCTLCFLEQVDRLVGKDHLFKHSIILIKAWCYYESRLLGAHHGLISTYALETLVLYIFHLFHSSLNGPLAVLYRFLDYFGKFDWDNYCISLNGPVCKSSLPDLVVELPENFKDDLMLSEEFLRNCMEMFSVPSRGLDTSSRPFPQKHLNIIDPLKENNNLGRSVHRGNFYRIRSAFKYGARKLGQLLLLPSERIPGEIKKFFANTLERHGSKCDADLQNHELTDDFLRNEPRFNFARSLTENGKFENGDLCQEKPAIFLGEKAGPDCSCTNDYEGLSSSGSGISTLDVNVLEKFSLDFREKGDLDASDPLLDLSGDYDNHIRSLLYGLCCHGYTLSAPVLTNPPPPTSQLRDKEPWETVCRSMPLKKSSFSQTNPDCVVLGQPFYPINNLTSTRFASGWEEKPKARGTGTYFPNTNGYLFVERLSPRKGRIQAQGRNAHLQRQFRNNGSSLAVHKTNSCGEEIHELPHPQSPVQGHRKSGLPCCPSRQPVLGNSNSNDNGLSVLTEKLEFGSFGLEEENSLLASGTSRSVVSTPTIASPEMRSPKPVPVNDQERVAEGSYLLKNEADFPPLSV